ncbi:DUF1028 domain-containing protein [uncultured Chitinophaga sp.]|uniref:DUF1028 domain-containing protein n=1 Tax=uncultured Chitinophaga sp. TaxID=339340 RepID=UPI0025E98070|nr:DUF1028 domain-containing protein [uncultured Chitinophaga sp.]
MQVHYRILFTLLLIAFSIKASATWSIIIIDPKTNTIGMAGASCSYSVYGIGVIIPGKGAVIVQAASHPLARKKGVEMMIAGATAQDIIKAMQHPDYKPEQQQYAVLLANDIAHPATYTGTSAPAHKGALTASGICVQGNTLTTAGELQAVMDIALKGQAAGLPLPEILMQAMEEGAKHGGDARCGERKASSAFMTIARPTDAAPYINFVVPGNNNTHHAVMELRKKYEIWKKVKG